MHEEAVRKGLVELDAKMSQFLVEYFLPESDSSFTNSSSRNTGQAFQQSSPAAMYQQQLQHIMQQQPSTKNTAPQRPMAQQQQPVRR